MISDHNLVSCSISFSKPHQKPRVISYRKINDIDIDLLKADLSVSPLLQNHESSSLDDLVAMYNHELQLLLDKQAPLQTRRIRDKPREPWWTPTIAKSRQKLRFYERKWRKSRNVDDLRLFLDMKSEFIVTLDNAKSEFIQSTIDNNIHDERSLFKTLNKVMHRKRENPMPDHTSSHELANKFSDYFQSKVSKIRDNFSKEPQDSTFAYDGGNFSSIMDSFRELTQDDTRRLIDGSSNKSCEMDPIPTTVLKQIACEITPVIQFLIDKSLSQGKFPDECKKAIVRPLLKKNQYGYTTKKLPPYFELDIYQQINRKGSRRPDD